MNRKTAHWRHFCVALLAATLVFGACAHAQSKPEIAVEGQTKPSDRVEYSFGQMGVIDQVAVERGQLVKPGQLLIQQDIRREENKLQQVTNEANSTARIDAADADLDLKKKSLARVEDMFKKNASNQYEMDEAQGKLVFAEATQKVTLLESQKNKLEIEAQKALIDQMKIKSRMNGFVEDIDVSEGEVNDPQKPSITVVVNDPLWVEVPLPTAQSQKLKLGDSLGVRYPEDKQWTQGKVIFKAPVADYSSGTQLVRLEVPNPTLKETGLKVMVNLPDNIAGDTPAAASATPPTTPTPGSSSAAVPPATPAR